MPRTVAEPVFMDESWSSMASPTENPSTCSAFFVISTPSSAGSDNGAPPEAGASGDAPEPSSILR